MFNMFYNPVFEDKINKVNEEFEKLLKEHKERKAGSPTKSPEGKGKKSSGLPSAIKMKDQRIAN